MKLSDKLEAVVFFGVTRWFFYLLVAGAMIMVAVTGVGSLVRLFPRPLGVDVTEVREAMQAQSESRSYGAASDPTLVALQAEVERLLAEFPPRGIDVSQMRIQVQAWLDQLSNDDDQVAFVREMREIIHEFPSADKARAAFAFASQKIQKLRENAQRRSAFKQNSLMLIAEIAVSLFLIILSSLVLVLFRIERNLRPGSAMTA